MKSIFKNKYQSGLMFLTLMAANSMVFAQGAKGGNKLKETIDSFTETIAAAVPLLQVLFFAAGFWAIGSVVWDFIKYSKQGGQKPEMSGVFIKIIGGIIGVSVGAFAYFSQSSIFGDDAQTVKFEEKIKFNK